MKKSSNTFSAFLLFLSVGLMMFPVVQKKFHLFKEGAIYGMFPAKDTRFTSPSWFDGAYSKQKEKYVNDNFGFRNWFVKLRNQVYYSLFHHLITGEMIEGKSGYVFAADYLRAYSGMDYVGDSVTTSRYKKLKLIQDSLASKGVLFILVFAPGEASYNSEYIPEPYYHSSVTNYLKSVEAAKQSGIDFLDFNAWFMQMKPTTKFPLYPKFSTHWSTYGVYKAFDSISEYIEHKLNKKLARYDYSRVYWTDSLINDDDEVRQDLNLLKDLPQFKLAYPIIHWKDTTGSFRPRLLGVGDSYLEKFYSFNLLEDVYKLPRFWMYYDRILDYGHGDSRENIGDMDLKSYVERQDVVILLFTETNFKHMEGFGWTFVDDLYNTYREGPLAYNKKMRNRKRDFEMKRINYSIRNSDEWFGSIKDKARLSGISVDSELNMNVRYDYIQEEKKWYMPAYIKILDIADNIRNDSAWLSGIKKQAIEKHLNLDSFLVKNAEYMYFTKLKSTPDSTRQIEIENMANYIYNDANWLHKIEIQSADLDIGLDSCVKLNAIYVIDNNNKK